LVTREPRDGIERTGGSLGDGTFARADLANRAPP